MMEPEVYPESFSGPASARRRIDLTTKLARFGETRSARSLVESRSVATAHTSNMERDNWDWRMIEESVPGANSR
jgi:hypothetical protein